MSPATLVMPTRVLIVGGGGREHALAWKLAAEPGINAVWVAPGSDAIAEEPGVTWAPGVDPLDTAAIVALARVNAIELVIIGPEAPLAGGVADALIDAGIAVFGPTMAAARIESSKAFCREVAAAAGVPMAAGRSFDEADRADASEYAAALALDRRGAVIKADGLAAGKGVIVCTTVAEARAAVADTPGRIVVEERLEGPEASLIALVDGADMLALPFARDHKRLGDDDIGPNTGGMGAYSPLPDLPDALAGELIDRFHRPVVVELSRRGIPFIGALYAGLMLTEEGPRLLEFNARFGDPETQVLMPRLAAPLGPVLLAAARGRLGEAQGTLGLTTPVLPALPTAAVGVVLASEGYPAAPRTGDPIRGLDAATADALVFHAGTSKAEDGGYRTAGGRVLIVVGRGPDLASARERAERAADAIHWPGLQRRRDIAGSGAAVLGGSQSPLAVAASG